MAAASLVVPLSSSTSKTSFSSSQFSPFLRCCSLARVHGPRCDLNRALNGKPFPPVPNDGTPLSNFNFLAFDHLKGTLNRNDDSRNGAKLKIFSGTANPPLSLEIARYMELDLGKISIKRVADGEVYVQLKESVRGCDVYLVQPTWRPANESLIELSIMIDACRRASAKNITAVIPYFGYAEPDRKTQGRESIALKLVADFITGACADRVVACDLHSEE